MIKVCYNFYFTPLHCQLQKSVVSNAYNVSDAELNPFMPEVEAFLSLQVFVFYIYAKEYDIHMSISGIVVYLCVVLL